MKNIGIYVHIPFCPYKCHYCDFLTFSNVDSAIPKYVKYLIREIEMYRENEFSVNSIFIGGGTPSHIDSKYIKQIMNKIYDVFFVEEDAEISIEMNPNTLNDKKIKDYLDVGINRFSVGVQTFDDGILRVLGRGHSKEIVFEDIAMMKKLGCKNISIDMMMANPKQDMDILKSDIKCALNLDVNHISYYSLILEEKTMFKYWLDKGKIELFDDDLERKMYHYTKQALKEAGFEHYEISNFAKEGKRSRHNSKYWNLEDYIGLGLGSSGNLDLIRYKNHSKFKDYYSSIDKNELPIMEREELNMEDREKEYIIMNMRMMDGFSIDEMNCVFNINFLEKYSGIIDKHLKYGNIMIDKGRLVFTDRGIDLSNQFYVDII